MSEPKLASVCLPKDITEALNAWIAPSGKIHYATFWGHSKAAEILGDHTGGRNLERDGWMHVSSGLVYGAAELWNQTQIDALFDIYILVTGTEGRHRIFKARCEEILKYV